MPDSFSKADDKINTVETLQNQLQQSQEKLDIARAEFFRLKAQVKSLKNSLAYRKHKTEITTSRQDSVSYPVIACSPKAKELINLSDEHIAASQSPERHMKPNAIYPFLVLRVAQSFAVPYTYESKPRLRNILNSRAYTFAKEHGTSYKVLTHPELKLFEVVRIA